MKPENGPINDVIDKLDFYCRYTDDTYIFVGQNVEKEELIKLFNYKNLEIKSTCGEKTINKLHFLDV